MTVDSVVSVFNECITVHGRVNASDAERIISTAKAINKAGSTGFWCCGVEGTDGTRQAKVVFGSNRDRFDPAAETRLGNWLGRHQIRDPQPIPQPIDANDGPIDLNGRVLVDVAADHRTWHCNWFPMGIRANSPGANLYYSANGKSVCEKLDAITGRNCTAIEKKTHTGGGLSWAGHCDMAARVCCLLEAPKHSVMWKDRDGNPIELTVNDIQGLLVMVSNELAGEEPMLGARNNGNPGDDPSEPYPHVVLPELIKWAKSGKPYVGDIDSDTPVWNYAFDKTKIQEFNSPQDGLSRMPATSGGKVKYQNWRLSGTGYDAEIRNYRSWVEYGADGKGLRSGWYAVIPNGKNNFDFLWQPVAKGNLMDKTNWMGPCEYNRDVDMGVVYDIYMASLR